MTRLPAITPRDLVAAPKRIGFEEHHQKGSHLALRHPVTKRRTIVAMHRKDLKRSTVKGILLEAGLTEEDILRLL